ncbi:MAG: hypothetical protein EXX96DRAFT_586086 [Benjaminiella poitrasii]|nr:MAG: hypothetical protein EXX96DRAFT_586086 [Benjaminiella poitrasii]
MMHSDVYFYDNGQNINHRTLRGPRPQISSSPYMTSYTPRQPRKPLEVYVSSRSYQEPRTYTYPPRKPTMERKPSKTEILFDHKTLPTPAKSASTKTIEEVFSSSHQRSSTLPLHKKQLPPRPVPKDTASRKPILQCYSSDEEDELDDEDILRELTLSRRVSVHDITISDDDEEEEGDEDEDISSDPPPASSITQKPLPTHTCHTIPSTGPTDATKTDLPCIPVISAPDYSDESEKANDDMMPPIPTICAPGGFSDDEEESAAKPQKSKLNQLFDSFYFGIRCAGCDEPLSGQAITTSGKHWHTYCFKCQTCHQNLEHIAFYEKDSLPYCALDYHELFSPRCDYCKTPIEEHSISALGKTYHPGHFFCRECGKPFDEEANFLEHDGHAYCEKDYYKQFGKSCKGCEEIITGDFLVALGGEWHKECFVCADCGGTFSSSTFLIRGGKPYCEEHYDKQHTQSKKKNGLLKETPLTALRPLELLPSILDLNDNKQKEIKKVCHHCQKPIEGRCHSAFGFDYHPLHFQCSQCNKLLSVRVKGLYQNTESNELICNPCVRKNRSL